MTNILSASQPKLEGRLKVLFLTPWYPDKENPVIGIFVREHARAVNLTDDVVVVHLKGNDPIIRGTWRMEPDDDNLNQGIRTYRLSHRLSPIPKTTFPFYFFSVFQAFKRLLQMGFQPDLLHAHLHRAGLPAVLLGKLFKIPVVITEHNSAFPRKMLRRSDILIARFAFSQAAVVLPVSMALQRGIQDLGIQASFQVVPNAVDTALFSPAGAASPPEAVKKLLFAGGLVPVKGLPILLQALAGMKEQPGNWQLDILGDGPELAAYQRQAEQFGLASKVFFHGARPKAEVASFMRSADLFVLPSLWENMPCVLLEAMASGLPVLSTLAGGIPEIVCPETGILVPPGDAEALRLGLAQMLASLPQFDRKRISAKAQKYSLQTVGSQIHSIYKGLLHG